MSPGSAPSMYTGPVMTWPLRPSRGRLPAGRPEVEDILEDFLARHAEGGERRHRLVILGGTDVGEGVHPHGLPGPDPEHRLLVDREPAPAQCSRATTARHGPPGAPRPGRLGPGPHSASDSAPFRPPKQRTSGGNHCRSRAHPSPGRRALPFLRVGNISSAGLSGGGRSGRRSHAHPPVRAGEVRLHIRIREIPGHLVHEPDDPLHLLVFDLFRTVVDCVVVGMESGVEEERRDAGLQEWPLVAAPEQIRNVLLS